ncbi:hypothetical protein [Flavobacterium sp.]|uniref:hypothetical protein n=1 Tax=Flavobacterium sp. TaxID=239 RepID=UPI002613A9E8|nr:hypothetical protein [Flavobacterium sp.]
MKRILSIVFLVLSAQVLWAQDIMEFVVIKDPTDTIVNIRESYTAQSSIISTVPNGTLLFCFGSRGNWASVEAMTGNEIKGGYIYKNFATPIYAFTELKPTDTKENQLVLQGQGIEIIISTGPFDEKQHTYKYDETGKYIIAIDDKWVWGTDGGMPTTEYKSVTVSFNGDTVTLPKEALHNLYQPNFTHTRAYYDEAADALYITTLNSDGAGGYCLVFVIKDKKYKERVMNTGF